VNTRRLLRAAGGVAASVVLSFVYLAALLLTPFRLGRLLRTVSIPRLQEHRLRTSLTVLGIALGVAVLIAVVIVNRSILGSMFATVDDIAGKADLQVSASGSGFDEALFDQVRGVPGVYKATPVLQQTALLRDPRARGERMLLLGVDLLGEDDEYFRAYASTELDAIKRDPLSFLNSPSNIIISRSLANKLGYKLHDKLPLATPDGVKDFDIWGFIENEGVGRAFGGSVAVMYYAAMQVAFGRGHAIDRIDLAVQRGADAQAIGQRVQATLGKSFHVERPDRKNERVAKMLVGLRTGLMMGSVIALLVGVFLIHNTMSISVVQRKREIGILRALGITRREVTRLITLEGFLLGLVGSGLGVLIGIGLARVMLAGVSQSVNELYLQVSVTTLRFDAALLVGGFLLGVVAATLASAFPARNAARPSPVETLRTFALMTVVAPPAKLTRNDLLAVALFALAFGLLRVPPLWGTPVGAMAASAGLLFGGALLMPRVVQGLHWSLTPLLRRSFGLEARLANDNLPRDLGRTAATASALMVGVAMATSFAVFVGSLTTSMLEWIDSSIPADLFITSAARIAGTKSVPMSAALYDPLVATPGVELVERVRIVDTDYRNVPVKLLAADIDVYNQRAKVTMLEGEQGAAMQQLRNGAVMVSENFSRRFGVHQGDRIQLSVKDGTREFEVAGVDIDYTSDQGTLLVDREVYVRYWGDDQVDTYELYLRKGADIEAVRRSVTGRYGESYGLFVLTNREFKAEILSMLEQAFAVMHVLELVALIIAVLGVVNSLFASVIDRVREIGVLRAVGMQRKQARKMIIVEGALIGVCGVSGGTLIGAACGYVLLFHINLVQSGWYFPYRPNWLSVFETAMMVVLVAALAAAYPARRAAALVVADALEYE
jgi:putative ABC transport system permease protein